jgi:hypothetical protein
MSLLIDLLLALIVLVTLCMSVWVIQLIFLRVAYIPSPQPVIDAMLNVAALKPDQKVVDLGAGDGRILRAAKDREPSIQAIGWEAGLLTWILGRFRCRHSGIQLYLGSLFKADLREADALVLYLWPSILKALMPKLEQELKPGAVIVSHSFELPGKTPLREEIVMVGKEKHTVRTYRW